jgi:hypothetical protein
MNDRNAKSIFTLSKPQIDPIGSRSSSSGKIASLPQFRIRVSDDGDGQPKQLPAVEPSMFENKIPAPAVRKCFGQLAIHRKRHRPITGCFPRRPGLRSGARIETPKIFFSSAVGWCS